jgi:hypothetical protein
MIKPGTLVLIIFLVLIIISHGVLFAAAYYSGTKICHECIFDRLKSIIQSKSEMIQNSIENKEKDINFLAESEKTKDMLKRNLISYESIAEVYTKDKLRIVSKEIENYLKMHPEMAVEDLQASSEFKKIAVRNVGEEGYIAVHDNETLVNYFHVDEGIIGENLRSFREEFPEFFRIIEEAQTEGNSSGVYLWRDKDGKIRKKYMAISVIEQPSADGKKFVVAATAYVENYKVVEGLPAETDRYFRRFIDIYGYKNLFLVSPEGYIIYVAGKKDGLGINLNWISEANRGWSKNYLMAEENKAAVFYGPFIGSYGDTYPKFSITAPVYEKDELLGYVGLEIEMKDIYNLIQRGQILGETMDLYCIDNYGFLISPLKNRRFDMLLQKIDSENSAECFKDLEKEKPGKLTDKESRNINAYLNYKGVYVFGTYSPLIKTGWCLLIEIEKEEALSLYMKGKYMQNLVVNLIILIVLILVALLSKFLIDKNYYIRKRKTSDNKKRRAGRK